MARPFVAFESSGTWRVDHTLSLPMGTSLGGGLACPAVADCVVAGQYVNQRGNWVALLATDQGGTWAQSDIVLPSSATAPSRNGIVVVTAPWCASPGNCIVVGSFPSFGTYPWGVFSLTETAGVWGTSVALPAGIDHPYAPKFACSSAGNCSVVAGFTAWTETNGTWSSPVAFNPAPVGKTIDPGGMACPSATTCLLVGFMESDSGSPAAPTPIAVAETNGVWGSAQVLRVAKASPPLVSAELWQVGCHDGTCVAVGDGGSFSQNAPYHSPIAATWSNGSWSAITVDRLTTPKAHERDASYLDDVSCTTVARCVGVGDHAVFEQNQLGVVSLMPFVATLSPTA